MNNMAEHGHHGHGGQMTPEQQAEYDRKQQEIADAEKARKAQLEAENEQFDDRGKPKLDR